MRSLLLPLFFAFLALPASAANVIGKGGPVLKNVAGNVWEVVHDAGNTVSTTRTWAKGTEIGSAKATDVFTWVYREKHRIPLSASATVGASAVGRIAAKTLPIVGTASLAYDVWTALRCKLEDGQIKCDPGIDPTGVPPTDPLWVPNGDIAYARSTPSAACSAYSGAQSPGCTSMSYNPSTYACTATCTSGYQAQYAVQAKCPSGYKLLNSGATWVCEPLDGSGAPGGQCPDGQTPSQFDGKCPSGNYVPKSEDEAGDHYGKNAPKIPGAADKAPGIVQEGVGAGVPAPSSPPEVSGPPSVSSPGPSVTTTQPNGTTSTTSTTNVVNLTYNGSQVVINESSTVTNPDGSTTTTDEPFMEWLCGVSGLPDCNVKVNESGTPEWEQPDNTKLDAVKAADAAKLDEVAQTIPTPDLGWFDAPPIAACRKIVFPHGIGEADPCGVVDSVRSVMAYLWALVASWMAFGWIRQAVNGG